MPTLATDKTCTGCMACVDICPKYALSPIVKSDGLRYVVLDPNKCINCLLCEKTCTVVNGSSFGENSLESEFMAGWSQDNIYRKNGATSGLASTIADYIISTGGYVAGTVMEGLECRYILTNNKEDISRIKGSKYTNSNPEGIYKRIREILNTGHTVLFTGLGCHCAGLLSFIPPKLQENLYVLDIICGGVSSSLLIDAFNAKNHGNIESIVSFRDKLEGWKPTGYRYRLTYKLKNKETVTQPSGTRNLVTDGFACALTNRISCYNCKYAYTHKHNDITIGDLWHDSQFPDQHKNGVSCIIVHSEKGIKLLNMCNIYLQSIDWHQIVIPNYRLYYGKSIKKWLPERRFLPVLFSKLSYESLLKVYASNMSLKDILWLPFAAYRKLTFKIDEIIRKKDCKKIIKKLK